MAAHVPPVQYASVQLAAHNLGLNINTVYRRIRAGIVPAVKVGREYRIPLEYLGITPEPVMVRANAYATGQLLLDLRW